VVSWSTTLRALVLVPLLLGCRAEEDVPRPDDLPERVLFRTATESFNSHWYLAVRDGRIWVKANEETGRRTGDWELLGASGRPEGDGLVRFPEPTAIEEISADGVHVQAISSDGVLYRGSNLQTDVRGWLTWTDRWGWPAGRGDGLTTEFSTERGWAVSDSHPSNIKSYTDGNGQQHSVGLGVAHMYRLGPGGQHIFFNDWWLPNDWSRQICGPDRGRFRALNISASGSTLFLIGGGGELYTRLYDFDTAGENPLYTYSFIVDGPAGTTRALPAEPWRRQPDIDGEITSRITIFQTGAGNAARTLRVEGRRDGETGFFSKNIDEESWSFESTGVALIEAVVQPEAGAPSPAADAALSGTLSRQSSDEELELVLSDFNVGCSPAQVQLRLGGETITANGEPLTMSLHHVHTLVEEARPTSYWLDGLAAEIRAALVIPAGLDSIDDAEARILVMGLLEERQVINFVGTATPESVELSEIPGSMAFRVPANEKGTKGQLYQLRATMGR
jgi:hypothetical protein